MRLPEINSRGMLILQTLLHRPMTIHQSIEQHGEFVTARAPRGIEHSKIVELYCDLVDRGCVVKEGIIYRLSLPAQYRLEALARPDEPGQIVPPRVRDIWSGQLSGYSAMLLEAMRR